MFTVGAGDKTRFMPPTEQIIADLTLADETATRDAAARLAPSLRAGDVIALAGPLGAGKTAFARALINALPGGEEDVPSPTFTLVQTYERGGLDVWHFDLYRLEDPDDAFELGIEDAFADAVSLIEWPERLGAYLPKGHLRVTLQPEGDDTVRRLLISDGENWTERLAGAFVGGRAHG